MLMKPPARLLLRRHGGSRTVLPWPTGHHHRAPPPHVHSRGLLLHGTSLSSHLSHRCSPSAIASSTYAWRSPGRHSRASLMQHHHATSAALLPPTDDLVMPFTQSCSSPSSQAVVVTVPPSRRKDERGYERNETSRHYGSPQHHLVAPPSCTGFSSDSSRTRAATCCSFLHAETLASSSGKPHIIFFLQRLHIVIVKLPPTHPMHSGCPVGFILTSHTSVCHCLLLLPPKSRRASPPLPLCFYAKGGLSSSYQARHEPDFTGRAKALPLRDKASLARPPLPLFIFFFKI